jgi:hypothetical protein
VGFHNFTRRYIPRFGELTARFTGLLKKNARTLAWSNIAQTAFMEIQNAYGFNLTHRFPNTNNQFLLKTDASGKAVGAALDQLRKGNVAKFLQTARLNFRACENMEVITFLFPHIEDCPIKIVSNQTGILRRSEALESLKSLLLRTKLPFPVLIDHLNLKQLSNYKPTKGRHTKKIGLSSGFNIKIAHLTGSENVAADALSRPTGMGKFKMH